MSLGCSPSRRHRLRVVGVVLVLAGILLLGGSIAYFLYGFKARADLGRLSYTPTPPAWISTSTPGPSLIGGFEPIDPDNIPTKHALSEAARIIIPSIDLDSSIEELQIKDLGDSREYETPKHVVGHIPETANAGEDGTAWFFGHLNSPIQGEGSVFRDLPELSPMLKNGEEVYAILEGESGAFLYKLTWPELLPENSLRLYDTGGPTLRLVTCVPDLYYNYRLVIWGELVGVRT